MLITNLIEKVLSKPRVDGGKDGLLSLGHTEAQDLLYL